jgi:outer membrane protein OmpA-like peptidoglycan-associated protein
MNFREYRMWSRSAALWIAIAAAFPVAAGDMQKANQFLQQALDANDITVRIQLLRKSIGEQSSFAGHYQLGKALRDTRQLNDAVREFRAALDLTSAPDKIDRAHALYQIGATYALEGNGAEALAYMNYSLSLETHPAVEQAILKLESSLASTVQPAAQLERALLAASRDLVLDDSEGGGSKVPVWIEFEFDRADLTSQGIAQAQELARALGSAALAAYRFRVIGHTDLIGPADYNLALSQRRAKAVTEFLSSRFHIPADRLIAEGHGMAEPLVANGSREQQGLNRRVEVLAAPADAK